jgi:Notch-like protein
LNNGTCIITSYNQTFECLCPQGTSGYNCEINQTLSDPCDPSPCQNGGVCQVFGRQPFCICPSRASGRYCEHGSFNPCDSTPCQNSGTCIPRNETFSCICPRGTTGAQCETEGKNTDFITFS